MTDRPTPRPWGTGSVYLHRGRWRARLPGKHGRRNLDGSYSTRAEAEEALAGALESLAAAPLGAPTLLSFGEEWLADPAPGRTVPERDVRGGTLDRDRLRWSAYVEGAPIATRPLVELEEHDVAVWLSELRGTRKPVLGAQTKQNALSLLRSALEAARERGQPLHGMPNPAAEVTLGKRDRERRKERWQWLRAAQVETVRRAAVPERPRLIFTIAIFSALRAGELWGLRLDCLDFDRRVISVRWSRGELPKNGEMREVPMLPPVYDALRRWLELREADGVRSHLGLVFPSTHGGYHAEGYDAGWSEYADRLGLGHATFHDLRHTGASHLLMGTWAPGFVERALRLEELQKWLGHKDIKTTQRYGHLAPEAIAGLVKRAKPASKRKIVVQVRPASGTQVGTHSQAAPQNRTGDLRFTNPQRGLQVSQAIRPDSDAVSRVVSRLRDAAERTAAAIAAGDVHRDHRALDLVDAAIATCEALGARGEKARTA